LSRCSSFDGYVKVVLDTNILVSSLLAAGPPAIIVDMVADGKIIINIKAYPFGFPCIPSVVRPII